jgi:hypothetical protein
MTGLRISRYYLEPGRLHTIRQIGQRPRCQSTGHLIWTKVQWDKNRQNLRFPPFFVKLSDEWVYLMTKFLPTKTRGVLWRMDFTQNDRWGGAPRANQRRSRHRGVGLRYSLGRGFKNYLRAGLVASVSSYPQTRLAIGEMDPQGRPSQFAGPERFSEEAKVDHVSAFRRTVLCRDI